MGSVYFIGVAGCHGPVKIGYSADPEARMETLAVWSPYPLEVLATLEGPPQLERRFHALFSDLHSHREWFHHSTRIVECVAAIKAGTLDVEGLPPPKALPKSRRHEWTDARKRLFSLTIRLHHRSYKIGLEEPEAVRQAKRRLEYGDDVQPEEFDALEAVVLEYLTDPLRYGTPRDQPWAKKALADHLQKTGGAIQKKAA